MTVSKSFAFAAPYTSGTFNSNQALLAGLNGPLTGMQVTTSGSVVSIQPGAFLQNGLIVPFNQPLSTTLPSGLVAPYSLW